jgi:hypothetical protein
LLLTRRAVRTNHCVPFCVGLVAAVNACTEDRVANVQWRVIATLKFKERCLYGQSLPGTGLRRSVCLLQLSGSRERTHEGCDVNYCLGLLISVTPMASYVKVHGFISTFVRFGTPTALTEDIHGFLGD